MDLPAKPGIEWRSRVMESGGVKCWDEVVFRFFVISLYTNCHFVHHSWSQGKEIERDRERERESVVGDGRSRKGYYGNYQRRPSLGSLLRPPSELTFRGRPGLSSMDHIPPLALIK